MAVRDVGAKAWVHQLDLTDPGRYGRIGPQCAQAGHSRLCRRTTDPHGLPIPMGYTVQIT